MIQSASTRRIRIFGLAVLAIGSIAYPSSLDANVTTARTQPEGFSSSSKGLPNIANDAWYATVLMEGREIILPKSGVPRHRTRSGSGIVIRLDIDQRTAVVATNAHIITCGDKTCHIRVGFVDPHSPGKTKWTKSVRVALRDPKKDLAFVEVELPFGAEPRVAKFASAECGKPTVDRVLSIGWPDLTVRKEWGIKRPKNFREHVKPYSNGLLLLWLRGYRMRPEVNLMLDRMSVVFHNSDVLPGSSGGPLVNGRGEEIGVNTMIVRDEKASDHHRFCARRDPHGPGQCVHAAIASDELIAEYERIYASHIKVADCLSSD